ncbi:MAG: SHOCT domain-containing protein [Candidatus Dormibacteria bacterium]
MNCSSSGYSGSPGWVFGKPWGLGGWLLGVVVVLMVVSLPLRIYLFSRRGRFFAGGNTGRHLGAEQILARRFAMGKIDEEEYRRRLQTLGSSATPRT